MHDQPTVERAVLGLVLDAHPKSLTIPDLATEINQGDAVERAVRDLVGIGLLERQGASIRPTRAAIHFDRLDLP
jgi:predicted transcriptional regulator